MRGATLYPLNVLRTLHPDAYEHERGKYEGREGLLELRIPLLDVLWNDALHLSPFHPGRLAAAWRAAGLWSPAWDREFFAIPAARLAGHASVWFASGALRDTPQTGGPLSLPPGDISPFDPARHREPAEVPAAYVDYLQRAGERDRPSRPYAYLPHVLMAGALDVRDLAVVGADTSPA